MAYPSATPRPQIYIIDQIRNQCACRRAPLCKVPHIPYLPQQKIIDPKNKYHQQLGKKAPPQNAIASYFDFEQPGVQTATGQI